jgi:hypothetical protein
MVRLLVVSMMWFVVVGDSHAGELKPETRAAWDEYVRQTERRIQAEIDATAPLTESGDEPGRKALLEGAVVVARVNQEGTSKTAIPNGLIHHWKGRVFVPGIRLDRLLAELQTTRVHAAQPDVLSARILRRDKDGLLLFLKLTRSQIVTATYNTEHAVTFRRLDATRAFSSSVATRIAELAQVGTPQEHERPAGTDRGFLRRLNAYWRYETVAGGVVVECESLSLSRSVPFAVRGIVQPLVGRVASDAMRTTLRSLRDALSPRNERSPRIVETGAAPAGHARRQPVIQRGDIFRGAA